MAIPHRDAIRSERKDRWFRALVLSGVMLAAVASWTGAKAAQKGPTNPDGDSQVYDKPLVYTPPLRGAPSLRVGGATRSLKKQDARRQPKNVQVLAPPHTGLTISGKPTLYWFVAKPGKVRFELAIRVNGVFRTVFRRDLAKWANPGIHAVDLADHKFSLKIDTEYRWLVAVVDDAGRRVKDMAASGTIRRISPRSSLVKKLSERSGTPKFYVYAEEGIFYDAVDELSKGIALRGDDRKLRQLRASLMDQIGLSQVAKYDRQ